LQQVHDTKCERACKKKQFATIFHLLQHDRPILEYKAMKSIFIFLGVPKMPKINKLSNNIDWMIVEFMHEQAKKKCKEVIRNCLH
jgi:hypothetical protein